MTQTQFNFNNFYTSAINNLTLQEALDIHYQINPQFTPWDQFDTPEARNLIKNHDISHVIFGCDTSYGGEYCVQTWNKYGSNLNISFTQFPKYIFNKDLVQIVLPSKLIQYAMTHIGEFMNFRKQIKAQAKLMTKKWEYFKEEPYMDKTIGEIRAEYGIEILEQPKTQV
jgi:ubiquinone biosynthesis protein Coq4